ncbi:hypothetical protein [Pseudomonas brassicacearum]|uniref:hypothetical protein n=1 Tax=Pseudomonas brassicacearum TaxID=930166 RepID=UPI002032946E|nr:hypothetical protein [Pseudomonas brassicacearum]
MLNVSSALSLSRASSFTCLAVEVQANILRGANATSVEQREKLNAIAGYLKEQGKQLSETSDDGFRVRSNSTNLPSKNIRDLRERKQEKNLNVFDHSPYKEKASENKKLELIVGKNLSSNAELASIAKTIREVTGSPMKFADFSQRQQEKIREESSHIGGAKELMADMDTLDAHVLATLVKAESEEYDLGDMERRKCMFNHVCSPDNPIYPWNSHRFDLEVFEVTNPIQYTENIRNLIADRWSELLAKTENVENYLFDKIGVSSVNLQDGILNIIQGLDGADRKKLLKDILHISWSTETFIEDEKNDRSVNPLGAEFRQHTTGAKTNVVRVSDKEDKNVNKWVYEAIVYGKPVTSGPSGHTLRYLNHYAMCSEMHNLSNSMLGKMPSLQEARLVMLANLMAPKDHHSYHEIMLASIGVFNGEEVLEYNNKDSYADIASVPIGAAALEVANAEMS